MRQIKYRQPYFNIKGQFSHWHYWGWMGKGEFIGPLSLGQVPNDEMGQQYIGLKDKNGVEVYEGDVVKGINQHEGQSFVFYGYAQWQPFAYLGCFDGNEFEVIGNIYQNPELLEQNHD